MKHDQDQNLNVKIDFDQPLVRGDKELKSITLRKPRSGELRGVNLADLLQMDVTALVRVIPRISEPALTEFEVSRLDPADLFQIGSTVSGFLLPRSMKSQVYQVE